MIQHKTTLQHDHLYFDRLPNVPDHELKPDPLANPISHENTSALYVHQYVPYLFSCVFGNMSYSVWLLCIITY